MPRRTLRDEIAAARELAGLPPLETVRRKQKNPHRLKVVESPSPSTATEASLATETPDALPEASLAREAVPARNPVERPNSGTGHARIYHDFFDTKIIPLSGHAKVLWMLFNRYRDHGKDTTIVLNWPLLARKSRFSPRQLARAAVEMESVGLIKRFGYVQGKAKTQGFRVWLASQTSHAPEARHDSKARLAPQAESKRNLKNKDIKPTQEEIETYQKATGRKWGE